jgi:hypothetical protein
MKDRRIRTDRQFDAQFRRLRHALVVLLEAAADFASLNPHDRVVSGGIPGRAQEDFCTNCAFLEALVVTVELIQNHIAKELAATVRALEVLAGQNQVQLLEHTPAGASGVFRLVLIGLAELRRFKC